MSLINDFLSQLFWAAFLLSLAVGGCISLMMFNIKMLSKNTPPAVKDAVKSAAKTAAKVAIQSQINRRF